MKVSELTLFSKPCLINNNNKVFLPRDLHIESLPAVFSCFPGHRRAPNHALKRLNKHNDDRGSASIDADRRRWPCQGRSEDWGGSSYSENSVINDF